LLDTRLGWSLGELENLAVEAKVVSNSNGSIFELLAFADEKPHLIAFIFCNRKK